MDSSSYLRFFITLFCLVFLTSASMIASAESKLTGKIVEQWLDSQKALEAWGDKHSAVLDKYEDQMMQDENPFEISVEKMIAPLKKSGLYDDAVAIVKKHGFDTIEQWAEATLSITKAAAAIEFENVPQMFDPAALNQMLNEANLPPEHKAMLENAMKHNEAMAKLLSEDVQESDKAAVKPYLDRISQLMDSE